MTNVLLFSSFLSFISFGYTLSVTKCATTDTKCLISSANAVIPIFAKGIPELGVESLDPAVFKKPIDASASGLKLIISDFVVKGLKDCKITKAKLDTASSRLIGTLLCDAVGDGQYEMDGQLLVLTVRGKGAINVVLRKILITLDAELSEKVKDGKKYWDIKRFKHSFELKDKADINFENLFTGSDVLGRAAMDVIKNNGNDIVLEVGPPVTQTITKKVVENIRKYFNHVPIEDLSLDWL